MSRLCGVPHIFGFGPVYFSSQYRSIIDQYLVDTFRILAVRYAEPMAWTIFFKILTIINTLDKITVQEDPAE
jgi:hypothetical protein